jgi:hypothetical protein
LSIVVVTEKSKDFILAQFRLLKDGKAIFSCDAYGYINDA